jgi:hypothetical protein
MLHGFKVGVSHERDIAYKGSNVIFGKGLVKVLYFLFRGEVKEGGRAGAYK